jgi:hypothetical protein
MMGELAAARHIPSTATLAGNGGERYAKERGAQRARIRDDARP